MKLYNQIKWNFINPTPTVSEERVTLWEDPSQAWSLGPWGVLLWLVTLVGCHILPYQVACILKQLICIEYFIRVKTSAWKISRASIPENMPSPAGTGPALGRCRQRRPSTGPAPACTGTLTGIACGMCSLSMNPVLCVNTQNIHSCREKTRNCIICLIISTIHLYKTI